MMTVTEIWIFHGEGGRFSSGAFSSRLKAEEWIEINKLSGVLTSYPMDTGIYDWCIKNKDFLPTKAEHYTSNFIQHFTSATQEHYHYADGQLD
ncbi:DUF7710 domain-containing protein [Dyadobacter diqingensis]|uniref:DUF7710 domain-containing protein n=1 Tax=Dyadobacter diqingensis TaxID=2938121 RepID=UPI0020C18F95|nr:hypothetical protein [Dyadobacter diqingensis]